MKFFNFERPKTESNEQENSGNKMEELLRRREDVQKQIREVEGWAKQDRHPADEVVLKKYKDDLEDINRKIANIAAEGLALEGEEGGNSENEEEAA